MGWILVEGEVAVQQLLPRMRWWQQRSERATSVLLQPRDDLPGVDIVLLALPIALEEELKLRRQIGHAAGRQEGRVRPRTGDAFIAPVDPAVVSAGAHGDVELPGAAPVWPTPQVVVAQPGNQRLAPPRRELTLGSDEHVPARQPSMHARCVLAADPDVEIGVVTPRGTEVKVERLTTGDPPPERSAREQLDGVAQPERVPRPQAWPVCVRHSPRMAGSRSDRHGSERSLA